MRHFLTAFSMLVTNEREESKGQLLTSSALDIAKISFMGDIQSFSSLLFPFRQGLHLLTFELCRLFRKVLT